MMDESGRPVTPETDVAGRPSLSVLGRVFVKLSLLGFGGPNAHLALMLDEVVERRRWLDREHFLQLMGMTNLLPGPNSSEMAIHVGYTQRGWPGAVVTGLAFLAPTFVMVTILSAAYFAYGSLPAVDPVFDVLKPIVLALILRAGLRLAGTAILGTATALLATAGLAVTVVAPGWMVPAMVVGGLATWVAARWRGAAEPEREPDAEPPADTSDGPAPRGAAWFGLAALSAAGVGTVGTVFLTHLWVGAVLFGGGYVLVALIEPFAVGRHGWVSAAQLLDGVALTQAVPGPISTLSAFIGYGAAGVPGALAGTIGVYLPAFAAVLLVAPHLERLRRVDAVAAALVGVNAVVAGTMVGVAVRLAPPAVSGWTGLALFVAALVAMMRFKVQPLWLIGGGLLLGVGRFVLG